VSVIDFHLHLFARPFFDALAAQSPQPGSVEEKLARASAKAGFELPTPDLAAHVARWSAEFERHQVEHACAFASVPEEIAALAEAAVLARGKITPFAVVNPLVEGVAERVRGLLATKGFRGVLLFPALHGYSIDDARCAPLLAVLNAEHALAYVHCGLLVVKLRDLLGLPRSADPRRANPLDLIPVANANPDARFVIPHFGAGFFRETLLAGAQCSNVFVDTSSSNSWIATQPAKLTLRDVFERTLGVFGAQRVLFGTDSNTFPRGWRDDRLHEQREILVSLGASAAERELVFAGSARRLLAPR
jgi:predicted TIM-barrel fold metal-dependent hydrolase